jgi:hypothetical protein
LQKISRVERSRAIEQRRSEDLGAWGLARALAYSQDEGSRILGSLRRAVSARGVAT